MIDPHVHLRDWDQKHKETIEHGLKVADRIGLSGVFDMPNTSPAITSRDLIEKRLSNGYAERSPVFYGVYAGVTANPAQIKEVAQAHKDYFPIAKSRVGVVGLKMFAGHSVGNLGIVKMEDQMTVYETLADNGYRGVLAVHCENEFLLMPSRWNPKDPKSHSFARPPKSEYESIKNQIDFAEAVNFAGNLHIAHVSIPASIGLIEDARRKGKIKITCGVTPHHCQLDYESQPTGEQGLLFKVNPPLRSLEESMRMFDLLKDGKIDWIETDHAPHTLAEKTGKVHDTKGQPQYMSGFPGLPFYPHFLEILRLCNVTETKIRNLTHKNIENAFGFSLPERGIEPTIDLHTEYEVDVYGEIRE